MAWLQKLLLVEPTGPLGRGRDSPAGTGPLALSFCAGSSTGILDVLSASTEHWWKGGEKHLLHTYGTPQAQRPRDKDKNKGAWEGT